MSLHWRVYREEIIGDTDWLPSCSHFKATAPYYYREISMYWLKWGVSLRWWWK